MKTDHLVIAFISDFLDFLDFLFVCLLAMATSLLSDHVLRNIVTEMDVLFVCLLKVMYTTSAECCRNWFCPHLTQQNCDLD